LYVTAHRAAHHGSRNIQHVIVIHENFGIVDGMAAAAEVDPGFLDEWRPRDWVVQEFPVLLLREHDSSIAPWLGPLDAVVGIFVKSADE
jgi:hypothetical protein